MKSILRITLTAFLFCLQICSSLALKAQCKVDTSDPVKGEFSINGTKVQINGDGGGVATASNNIPIKICEGELIKLKSTLSVTAQTSVSYWILSINSYLASSIPVQSLTASVAGSYSSVNGSVDLRLIEKSSYDPQGLSFYNGPGKYVIVQYDNSTSTTTGPGIHHACQVIEVIKPTAPVATATNCSNSEFLISFPQNSRNIYDDYEITFNALVGNINPILRTGKPEKYPFSIKSENLLNSSTDRIITIKGLSVTGNCTAPITNLGVFKGSSNKFVSKPTIISIEGKTQKGEFKLNVSSQNNVEHSIFIREALNYDYTKVFKSYTSKLKIGIDSIGVSVPDGNKQYCFRVEAIDSLCPLNNFRSNEEICTTPASVVALNNKNVISWVKANNFSPSGIKLSPFNFYQIERLNPDGTVDKVFPSRTNIETIQEEDVNLICGQVYTYRVKTNYGISSYSQPLKVTAKSDDIPFKIPRLIATLDFDNKILVQGVFNTGNLPNDVNADNYKFYRSNAVNGTFSLQKTGNSIIKDQDSDASKQSYCYYMTWTNLCNIESESSEKVCTIFQKNNNGILEWTKENSHSAPTDSYIVQEVDSKGINIRELGTVNSKINSFDISKIELNYGEQKFFQIEARPVGWNTANINRLPSTLSNVIRIFKAPLANQQEEDSSVKIYPNPSQDHITVELKNDKPEIVNWTLHNSSGQVINKSISDNPSINYQSQIDTKHLQKGIYLLKIEVGERSIIRKIIKD
jgi:Secretion system C-terminal sorting domain